MSGTQALSLCGSLTPARGLHLRQGQVLTHTCPHSNHWQEAHSLPHLFYEDSLEAAAQQTTRALQGSLPQPMPNPFTLFFPFGTWIPEVAKDHQVEFKILNN